MKRVAYKRTEMAVLLDAAGVTLIYGGEPYVHDTGPWSITAAAFETLRAENPSVEFVEQTDKEGEEGATKGMPTVRRDTHISRAHARAIDRSWLRRFSHKQRSGQRTGDASRMVLLRL
jgi:hypothetical protein